MGGRPPKLAGSAYGLTCRSALAQTNQHPEIIIRTDALLCSINDRLGALVRLTAQKMTRSSLMPKAVDEIAAVGSDVTPLSGEWLDELLLFNRAALDALPEPTSHGEAEEF